MNIVSLDYEKKFPTLIPQTLFSHLDEQEQQEVKIMAFEHRFTLQELKKIVEGTIDLRMWNEGQLSDRWKSFQKSSDLKGREFKKWAFLQLENEMNQLKNNSFHFKQKPELPGSYKVTKKELTKEDRSKEVFGMCAVQSEKTSCCNLRTIDAVKNCGFGCSYCSIQTMYGNEKVVFDENLQDKLDSLSLDKNKLYHIGTGQASDSLMWGNQHGVLDSMLGFAKKWPNVLLEFKTKSKNVRHLLKVDTPKNIVCSWSVNPQAVIENEEHLTASLEDRLKAAEACVSKGIKVGFHLHPMIFYRDWEADYSQMIDNIVSRFKPSDVLFISFGSLTFSKPVMKKIRQYNINSKMLQMPMVSNPEGKQTYPNSLKAKMFSLAYDQFKSWQKEVYFFLCMEEYSLWDSTFGHKYKNNEEFEDDFMKQVFQKIK